MAHIDCTFHLTDAQLDSPWGEDDTYFLILRGQTMDLELQGLDMDDLNHIIDEIENGMRLSGEERKQHEVEELLYQPPPLAPINLSFCFDGLGGLQTLYQPPDHLWEMVFDDGEDESQAHVMMSTRQVESLLKSLKEKREARGAEDTPDYTVT